jgi:chaperonin cofactor prefoldin
MADTDGKTARAAIKEKLSETDREVSMIAEQIDKVEARLACLDSAKLEIDSVRDQVAAVRSLIESGGDIPLETKRKAIKWLRIRVTANRDETIELQVNPLAVDIERSSRETFSIYTIVLVA